MQSAVQNARQYQAIIRYLLTPIAVAGYTLAAWRLGSDMGWTGEFFISAGLFSHWQVWLALAIGTHVWALNLDRIRTNARNLHDETVPT